MRALIRWPFHRPTRRQRAERATDLAVPTQDIGRVKVLRQAATVNGLLAVLTPDRRASVRAKLEAARAAR